MPIEYFRWVKSNSADLITALNRNQLRSTYLKSKQLIESRSALWVFRMDGAYKPNAGLQADRTLIKITLTPEGEAVMESPENHQDYESAEFQGEAGHPLKIIIKNNEQGARGLGARILEFINARVSRIELASARELKRATG